jgi:hypothetical protein
MSHRLISYSVNRLTDHMASIVGPSATSHSQGLLVDEPCVGLICNIGDSGGAEYSDTGLVQGGSIIGRANVGVQRPPVRAPQHSILSRLNHTLCA